MIDPATTKPGDWVCSLNGISKVLGYYRGFRWLSVEEVQATGKVVEPTSERIAILKTFCNYDKKPKLCRYMEEVNALSLCDPIEGTDYAAWVDDFPTLNPKRWNEFEAIEQVSIGNAVTFPIGQDLGQGHGALADLIDQIERALVVPPEGWTLNDMHAALVAASTGFDLTARRKPGAPAAPATLSMVSRGFRQTDDGLDLFPDYRIVRRG